jgi:hypothetical protein
MMVCIIDAWLLSTILIFSVKITRKALHQTIRPYRAVLQPNSAIIESGRRSAHLFPFPEREDQYATKR